MTTAQISAMVKWSEHDPSCARFLGIKADATLRECDCKGRPQPGRPVTTGSAATKKVAFRVSAAQRAELDAEAKRLGLSSADVAAKRRTFPVKP